MKDPWKDEIETILSQEDRAELLDLARKQTSRVLRYLCGRLYSASEAEMWRAVRGLGAVVADGEIVSLQQATELLRRFLWALNDESGMVPYGIPEAIGEVLAVRPELQGDFLPMLCSLVTDEAMLQTGAIERGILWALGRVGPAVAGCSPEAVGAVEAASRMHPDHETREMAARCLALVREETASPQRATFPSTAAAPGIRERERGRHGAHSDGPPHSRTSGGDQNGTRSRGAG